ncbi:hypothetical protein [Cereibacter johrii]|uniref:hypothetical protein n=1 Tax=Cereibacter johrii TaxID=445629 RepID=UPI00114CC222|nr:hypothetical protein [Cereibacter johrii]MEA5163446.1 hypothetical protein [Cereibacter johrii]
MREITQDLGSSAAPGLRGQAEEAFERIMFSDGMRAQQSQVPEPTKPKWKFPRMFLEVIPAFAPALEVAHSEPGLHPDDTGEAAHRRSQVMGCARNVRSFFMYRAAPNPLAQA